MPNNLIYTYINNVCVCRCVNCVCPFNEDCSPLLCSHFVNPSLSLCISFSISANLIAALCPFLRPFLLWPLGALVLGCPRPPSASDTLTVVRSEATAPTTSPSSDTRRTDRLLGLGHTDCWKSFEEEDVSISRRRSWD